MIERKYPSLVKKRRDLLQQIMTEQYKTIECKVNNLAVMSGLPIHLLPGMNAILTVAGRKGLDLLNNVTRGNRRFLLLNDPQVDMNGFILEIKRVNPTTTRGESLVEVVGVERFIADSVYIPEDRQGLY